MKSLGILLIASFVVFANGRKGERILGGRTAGEKKYPYMVSIQAIEKYGGQHKCGGSIIDSHHILTAAHCLKGYTPENLYIVAGTINLYQPHAIYYPKKLIYNTNFSATKYVDDVGLIITNQTIKFNDYVQPIGLQKTDDADKSNYFAILTGWGMITNSHFRPNMLQEISLKVISEEECKVRYSVVNPDHICTKAPRGEGFCSGDSGSPLVANGVQIGIVSFNSAVCGSGNPDVYARVSHYNNWIADHMEN